MPVFESGSGCHFVPKINDKLTVINGELIPDNVVWSLMENSQRSN